jgi:hypothetical protein
MRALNQRQAQRCEDAKTKRCRCRCGGAMHGVERGDVLDLAADDPHHAEEARTKKKGPR